MNANKLILAGLAALVAAAPALARDKTPDYVATRPVADKPVVTLDPAKAYVLLRSDAATPLYLMRVPTAAEQADYTALRAEALSEAHAKYAKKQARYLKEMESWKSQPVGPKPEAPIEPTEANFSFPDFGTIAAVGIGPLNRFAKGKGASTYLQELAPGEYRVYGALSVAPNGMALGSCFCMGSVRFEVRAGEITDMGVLFSKDAEIPKAPAGDSSYPALAQIPNFLGDAPADLALDPRLASFTMRRAQYRPFGKSPNYFGVTITRVPEMPGVLRYERDRVVDLTKP